MKFKLICVFLYFYQEGDKIYLVRQETADWMYGRSKRGCEGLFPVNYVDIKVPLKSPVVTNKISNINQQGPNYAPTTTIKTMPKVVEEPVEQRRCRALYDFNAEAEEDLSITVRKEWIINWEMLTNSINKFPGRRDHHCRGGDQCRVADGT